MTLLRPFLLPAILLLASFQNCRSADTLRVGSGRAEMNVFAEGVGMYGYGQVKNVVRSEATPLHARALLIVSPKGDDRLLFVSCELAFITQNVKDTVVQRLQQRFPQDGFSDSNVMLTATHTHAGPGSYAHDALYNITTGGYHCGVFNGVVAGIVEATAQARDALRPSWLLPAEATFADSTDVAWNRALKAWNRNLDVVEPVGREDAHLALDRTMRGLAVVDDSGRTTGLVNWFGVHSTCVDNKNTAIHFDNKGHASALFEAKYPGVVAMFAQEKAGDVSPNYHGPKGKAGRRARRSRSADHGFALALNNGGMQAGLAEKLLTAPSGDTLSAVIDHELIYVNMANTAVDPDLANGLPDARTAPACHGMAFTCGTPVDGKGAPRWVLQIGHFFAFKRDRRQGDEQRAVLAPQGPKKIMTNAHNGTFLGRYPDRSWTTKLAFKDLKRQGPYMRSNPLVQEVVPVQLFIIGELCIVGLPAEITTHAGDQLVEVVRQALAERGVKRVVIASYANAYVGYVTTYEEYQAQTYEGGHTLFGEWELGAFQTEFRRMARAMLNPDRTKRALDRSTRHRYETKELCGRSFPGSCAACRE